MTQAHKRIDREGFYSYEREWTKFTKSTAALMTASKFADPNKVKQGQAGQSDLSLSAVVR